MDSILSGFWVEFCKVDIVCHAGSPNWLGWIVLGFAGLIAFIIIHALISAINGLDPDPPEQPQKNAVGFGWLFLGNTIWFVICVIVAVTVGLIITLL